MRLMSVLCGALLLGTSVLAAASSDVADAAMRKSRDTVRSLVQKNADVNAPQADGTTALHWAARWDDLEMAQMLLRAGAKPGMANRDGATPMFLASQNGSAPMVTLLVKAGADPNAPVLSHGETALMMAARTGKIETVRALVDLGAQLNTTESLRGTSALMWAADEGHADVVQFLIDKGADLEGRSAVLTPVKRRGLGFARPGPDGSGGREKLGRLSPLLFAARQGHLDVARTLVAAGANVNAPAVDGSSPLLVAVQNAQYDVAHFLLEHGADPNQENEEGWTPIFLAVVVRDPLTTAVPPPGRDGALVLIKDLLDRGADPNHPIKVETEVHTGNNSLWLKEAGATPLLRASLFGDLTVVRMLLDHGADPLIPTLDRTTPLMTASGVGWADGLTFEYSPDETLEVVKLLLAKGADARAVNDHGHTALHGAAYKGANKVVQLLVDSGADLALKDKGEDFGFGVGTPKMTPLDWAMGVPVNQMTSSIYRGDTVALLTKLMEERGIPIEFHNPGYNSLKPATERSAP